MSCELWRVIVHLLQVICHCYTRTLFITSPLISPPLSRALHRTPTLRLRNERTPLSLLLLPLVDDMSLPWGIQDEDNSFLPFIHAVLAPWCQAQAHARSTSPSLLPTTGNKKQANNSEGGLERTQAPARCRSQPVAVFPASMIWYVHVALHFPSPSTKPEPLPSSFCPRLCSALGWELAALALNQLAGSNFSGRVAVWTLGIPKWCTGFAH